MTKREYLRSTPKDIRYVIEAHNDEVETRMKAIQVQSWLTGAYVMNAIGATFGKAKYPESPIENTLKEQAKASGRSEEEMNGEKFIMTMRIMQANANIEEALGKE